MQVNCAETTLRTRATAALLLALALIALAAAVGSERGEAAGVQLAEKLRQQPCPELALTRDRTYSDREVNLALRGRFVVAGDRVKLKPKVNWFKNHKSSREFQEQLHSLRWLDVLFQAYRDGNRRAILQARRLAVDWVEQNPLRQDRVAGRAKPGKGDGKPNKPKPKPVPQMAWQNLVAGDRASYLGYVTRAAACEGMLPNKPAKDLLDSVKTHGAYLSTGAGYLRVEPRALHGSRPLPAGEPVLLVPARGAPLGGDLARSLPQTLAGRTSSSGIWLEHRPTTTSSRSASRSSSSNTRARTRGSPASSRG